MKSLIKNNIEIFVAVSIIIIIAGVFVARNINIGLWQDDLLEFDESHLIELMKDRPEGQRDLFMQRIDQAKITLAENTEDSGAYEILGFLHDTLGDKETAEKYYKKVLKLNPESVIALNNLANVYNDNKEYKKAEELYLKITEVDPGFIEAWRDLHDLYKYSYKEKLDQADDILILGLEKNPNDPQILAMLAVYYQEARNTADAIKYYELLIQVMPENEAAKNELLKLRGY